MKYVILTLLSLLIASVSQAQHARLYACVLADDTPGSFMGGSSLGSGLWTSDDTGRTWQQLGWKHVKCYSVDVVERSQGKIIYLACGNGVLKSTDAGTSWRVITDLQVTEVTDVAVDQMTPSNLYISTAEGLWKSSNEGASWKKLDVPAKEPYASRIKVDRHDARVIVAAMEEGIFISRNRGISWKQLGSNYREVRDIFDTGDRWLFASNTNGIAESNPKLNGLRIISKGSYWAVSSNGEQSNIEQETIAVGPNAITFSFTDDTSTGVDSAAHNLHAVVQAGKDIIGSLDNGVAIESPRSDGLIDFIPSGLFHKQVWTLRKYVIR